METKHLQSLIHKTRQQLAEMYKTKAACKLAKSICDEMAALDGEYEAHNQIKRLTKDIAKLVEVQKALKKEMAFQIATVRYYANDELFL